MSSYLDIFKGKKNEARSLNPTFWSHTLSANLPRNILDMLFRLTTLAAHRSLGGVFSFSRVTAQMHGLADPKTE